MSQARPKAVAATTGRRPKVDGDSAHSGLEKADSLGTDQARPELGEENPTFTSAAR
jgi:hypothetical protein